MFLLIFQSKSIIKKLQQEPERTASLLMSSNLASVVSENLFLREHSMFILKYFFPKYIS